jgi:hypothetical protein
VTIGLWPPMLDLAGWQATEPSERRSQRRPIGPTTDELPRALAGQHVRRRTEALLAADE